MATAARPRVVAGLRLLRQVGEGSEGEVWEARDQRGRTKALKLIRPNALVPPAEVQRRGRWLLAIDHPALVTVHRCGVLSGAGLDGWGFVEMAFVDGPALDVAPADPDALERLAPLAEALDLLHAGAWSDGVPLVHRDVKPANLIVDEHGDLVLVDASTLRDVDDDTRTRIGTPLYAAPEVVTGRAGPLADVYGFAATAVALLTGARRGELAALLQEPGRLDVPEGLRTALAADPADRPVSCRAALDPSLPLIVGHEVGWGPVEREAGPEGGSRLEWEPWDLARPWAEEAPPEEGGLTSVAPAPEVADASWEASVDPGDAFVYAEPAGSAQVPAWPAPSGAVAYGSGQSSAAQVLLEPWLDPFAPPEPHRPAWGWLAVLATLGALPLVAVLGGWSTDQALPIVATVAGAHVVAGLAARRSLGEVLLAPPLAWASLLARRSAPAGAVRGWARTTLLACVTVLAGVSLGALLAPDSVEPVTGAILAAGALAASAAALHAGARGGRLWRAALAPAWVLGTVLFAVGAALVLVPAALVGRGSRVLGAVGRTLGGSVAFVRRS